MHRLFSLILCLLLTAGATGAAAQIPAPAATGQTRVQTVAPAAIAPGPRRTGRIEAELVAMSRWAAPGSTAIVAVRQKIAPGWHTYWRNPGDSGGATTLNWRLPVGVKAGDIVWPTPERQRLLGLVNYGYSDAVYLPVPIEIPADAPVGRPLRLTVEALFLVCSDQMCVPEPLTLALDLPVREGAAPLDPAHGAAIRRTLETAPALAGITAQATLVDGRLTLSTTGGPLAAGPVGAVWFFPFEGGVIDHAAGQPGVAGPDGLSLTLTPDADLTALTGPVRGVLLTDRGAWEISAAPGPVLPGTTGGRTLAGAGAPTRAAVFDLTSLLRAAGLALLGGLVLNLMPCVFPILAMKAASLAATAHRPAEARRDGLLFLAGVLISFLFLAGLLLALRAGGAAVGWGFQLQSPPVTAGLAVLMLAVAMNLSGVFHVGAGVQGLGAGPMAKAPRGVGAFLTGVLAVVVAAPCTAPFMAAALGAALVMPWPAALAVFLMLGLGLALPYLAVSLSPGVMKRLPRPGVWMERVKALLAFPMYGAALWLAWVFARQVGSDGLGVLFAAGLMLALALWLAGRAQAERAGGATGRLAVVAALLTLLAAVALFAVAAQAKPETRAAADAGSGPLQGRPWSEAAVAAALAEGRPVLVNFTADWCVTCKINEGAALSSPRTAEALRAANAVYLVGDWTRRDDAITAELTRLGRSGVPLYLLFTPGEVEPRVLPQLLTAGAVVEALEAAAQGPDSRNVGEIG